MKLAWSALCALVALGIAQIVYYYPRLPAHVASNFAGNGEAQAWMSKQAFVALDLALLAVLAGSFAVIPLLGRLSPKWWNLPNKNYWLAPERRAATIAYVSRQGIWMGVYTMLFVIFVMQMVLDANLRAGPPRLSSVFLIALVVYLAYTAVWTFRLLRRFKRPVEVPVR